MRLSTPPAGTLKRMAVRYPVDGSRIPATRAHGRHTDENAVINAYRRTRRLQASYEPLRSAMPSAFDLIDRRQAQRFVQ